jgi:GMP synthase-like glutamine amidotransferase
MTAPAAAGTQEPLRVGLLLCDHLDDDVAAQVGDYTELFPDVFGPVGLDLVTYEATRGELPADTSECDGWIVSGSRRSVYEDEPWIHELESFVRRVVADRRRLLGVCFGHQLTAQALGGAVAAAEVGWGVGVRRFQVVDPAPWMDPVDGYTILMSHRDQVTRVPPGAQVIATAEYCPVGAYRIEDHVFCVQGHPEWVPELSSLLMQRRRDVIGEDVVEQGLASLEVPVDREPMARWVASFFRDVGSGD